MDYQKFDHINVDIYKWEGESTDNNHCTDSSILITNRKPTLIAKYSKITKDLALKFTNDAKHNEDDLYLLMFYNKGELISSYMGTVWDEAADDEDYCDEINSLEEILYFLNIRPK